MGKNLNNLDSRQKEIQKPSNKLRTEVTTRQSILKAEVKNNIHGINDLYKDIIKSKDIKVVEWLFFGLILVGIIIKAGTYSLYSQNTDDMKALGVVPVGPATGAIWGYSIVLFAVIGLIFISVKPEQKNMDQIKNIPYSLYAMVIILLWSIILNVRFYSTINTTVSMPMQYNTWNNWSVVTIALLSVFCAIGYFIKAMEQQKQSLYTYLSYQMNVYSFIVFFAAIIVVGIQQSILDNFLVAG